MTSAEPRQKQLPNLKIHRRLCLGVSDLPLLGRGRNCLFRQLLVRQSTKFRFLAPSAKMKPEKCPYGPASGIVGFNKFFIRKTLFVLFVLFLVVSPLSSQELRVATYNLRYDNPQDSLNNWQYRKNTVAKLIRFHDFDIFGTQEGLKHQLDYLAKALPGYAYVGVGRDDGRDAGEHSAIFYKKDLFELLDKGDFWLSEDTTRPNKGWDAVLPRICSWGKFKDKSSGLVFFFFNTHFDHIGTIARKESSKLILNKINEITGEVPTILTGDFNVDQHSPSYNVLEDSNKLADAYDTAKLHYGADGTFNGFKINSRTESRIDHIFITKDFKVVKHGILTDTYQTDMEDLKKLKNAGTYPRDITLFENEARLPSDHYPVIAVLKL